MQPIYKAWCVQIDITNHCFLSCLYCSRYNRHLRQDQRRHMTLEQVEAALDSLLDWPNTIGIIGGEPLLHPDFPQITKMIRKRFPAEKMGLWTSGGKNFKEYIPYINRTFTQGGLNEHSLEQLKTCKHQPLTVAINDVVPDKELRRLLIDDCWVQRTWCPTINHFGAYFCEVAAAQDVLLHDGKHAWPVEPGWWKKTPDQFQDQVEVFCGKCGMAVPMETELILNKRQKISKSLFQLFVEKKLERVTEKDLEVFEHVFTREEIMENIKTWYPGNYRGDLQQECNLGEEWKGFTKKI